jgi:hypothetical protein
VESVFMVTEALPDVRLSEELVVSEKCVGGKL